MSTKELQETLIENMAEWKKVEGKSIASTGKILEQASNPIVRMMMEVIQRDSLMHYRVQDFIQHSLQTEGVRIQPEELGEIWGMIEEHIELERKTIEIGEAVLEAMPRKGMAVQRYLLEYLMMDEEKHNKLLDKLSQIKENMYPYG